MVRHLRRIPVADARVREPGDRGGPLHLLDDRMHWWLDQANGLANAPAALDLWEHCLPHGDLIPGNLLVADGRLTTVLD